MTDESNDRSSEEVTPNFKGSTGSAAPPPAKRAPAAKKASKKAAAKKAPAAKKAAASNRTASAVSKEGTLKDEFTGELLPVTAFPTKRQADGTYKRTPPYIARKNLAAWRADKKEKRAAAKAAAAKKAPAAKKAAATASTA